VQASLARLPPSASRPLRQNILANSDCKLKICDFGLARPAFNDAPTTIFWTDYVATRWYRAPELCGCFFTKYTKTIDVWSIGCIFAEILSGKPLFPGRNVVHQLELITDLLGTPSPEEVAKVRNEKARRFLSQMRPKTAQPFASRFPRAAPGAVKLLERLLAFDPTQRPTADDALLDPYFAGLHNPAREPVAEPISKLEFEFEKRKLTSDEVRDLIYREVLEYHPQAKREYLSGEAPSQFTFPSAVDAFKRQFAHLESEKGATSSANHGDAPGSGRRLSRQSASLPREQVDDLRHEASISLARSETVRTYQPEKLAAAEDQERQDEEAILDALMGTSGD
jgi:serine/threonine protein kinase